MQYEKLYFQLPTDAFDDEEKFTAWLGNQIDSAGGFWKKISDQSQDNKPCDSIVALNGIHGLLEIKVGDEKKHTDVYKKLRNNQKFFLKRRKDNGGLSLVLYYNKFYNKYWVLEFSKDMLIFFSK